MGWLENRPDVRVCAVSAERSWIVKHKDLAWKLDALAAYGYKPDGTVKKVKPKKETA